MELLHALAAVLAAFRLTTLFTQDAIWDRARRKFPQVPWYCSLCMSVWASILATAFLLAVPYVNWPLAISWLYLAYERTKKVDSEELTARVNAMQAEYEAAISALAKRSSTMAAEIASLNIRVQEKDKRIAELEKAP